MNRTLDDTQADLRYAVNTVTQMLERAHQYKAKHVSDVCKWHRSYREQLAAERKENLELRATITDMGCSAARGMEALRLYRRHVEGSDEIMRLKAENTCYRQLARHYKRRAFEYADPNDEEFWFSSNSDEDFFSTGGDKDQDKDNNADDELEYAANLKVPDDNEGAGVAP
jgi:hypothetical protein